MKTALKPTQKNEPRTLDRVTFGRRLRATRKQLKLTLAKVAARSGVSITTISRAERGQLALSYEKFSALGRSLQMDIGVLFSRGDSKTSGLDQPVITRAGDGVRYRGLTVSYEFLAANVTGKQMSPILGTVHARSFHGPQDYVRHDGEEFVHVLSGATEVHFEDGRVLQLARGDSLYFDSRVGHAYTSTSRRLCKVIAACTSESSYAMLARERADLVAQNSADASTRKTRTRQTGRKRKREIG